MEMGATLSIMLVLYIWGPGCGQLVVEGIPGGERQPSRHFILSGDDVLDCERVFERGRLGYSQAVTGHLGEVGAQGAEPELGVLLEVVGSVRGLAGRQVL